MVLDNVGEITEGQITQDLWAMVNLSSFMLCNMSSKWKIWSLGVWSIFFFCLKVFRRNQLKDRMNNGNPKRCPGPNFQNQWLLLYMAKGILRWGRLSWIIRIGRCNHHSFHKREAGEIRVSSRWCDHGKRSWSNARKGSWAKECRWPLEAIEVKEMDSSSRASKGNWPYQHFDFSPVRVILDIWPPELYKNKLV